MNEEAFLRSFAIRSRLQSRAHIVGGEFHWLTLDDQFLALQRFFSRMIDVNHHQIALRDLGYDIAKRRESTSMIQCRAVPE